MSLSTPTVLEYTLFIILSTLSIASSIFIIRAKELVYAAISLGILGLSIASLIAVFFSPLYGVLHVIIYVGATVTFIVVVGVMLRGAEVPRASNWKALLASVLSFLFLTGLLITIASKVPPQQSSLDLVNITSTILRDYYFPVIILIIALAATLIEAITIARRD